LSTIVGISSLLYLDYRTGSCRPPIALYSSHSLIRVKPRRICTRILSGFNYTSAMKFVCGHKWVRRLTLRSFALTSVRTRLACLFLRQALLAKSQNRA